MKRRKSYSAKRLKRDAENFKRSVVNLIKGHWPDATVEAYEEKAGIKKPDILIKRDGLEIPVEVKSRKHGYFCLLDNWFGYWSVGFNPITIYPTDYRGYKKRNFFKQVGATLGNYDACFFLVQGEVRPQSPSYHEHENGKLLVLSNFTAMEQSLDLIYDSLKKRAEGLKGAEEQLMSEAL